MRPDRFVVQLIVGVVALAYLGWLVVERQPITGITTLWGLAASAAWIAWVVLDRWAWRWRFLNWLAGRRPDIQGTWRGVLASGYEDPSGARVSEDPDVYLVIRETYTTVSARLLTRESKSETIVGTVLGSDSGSAYLVGVYRNVPRSSVLHRSGMHHGALILDIEGSPPTRLDGRYWTERGTRGELRLGQHARTLVDSYDEGHALLGSAQSPQPQGNG